MAVTFTVKALVELHPFELVIISGMELFPNAAVQPAPTRAVIVPAELVMPVTVIPVGSAPVVTEMVPVPDTVPIVASVGAVPD